MYSYRSSGVCTASSDVCTASSDVCTASSVVSQHCTAYCKVTSVMCVLKS